MNYVNWAGAIAMENIYEIVAANVCFHAIAINRAKYIPLIRVRNHLKSASDRDAITENRNA